MATTTAKGVPYPVPSDVPDVPADMGALATWVDGAPGVSPLTTAQRDALSGAGLWAGRTIYNSTTGRVEAYTAVGWLPVAGYVQTLTTAQRDALALKPLGLTLFNSDTARLQTYDGTRWQDYGFMPNLTTTQRDALTSAQKLPGQIIWNTTNGVHEAWNGTTWGQIAGGAGAGSTGAAGIVGFTSTLATGSAIGATYTTLLTLTFAALPGRRYRASGWVNGTKDSNIGGVNVEVFDGATLLAGPLAEAYNVAGTYMVTGFDTTVATGAAARSMTITVQIQSPVGTWSPARGFLIVEDVGADTQVATPVGIVNPNVWNTAWGAIAPPQVLAADSGAAGSSYATVGGFIITATLLAGRRYKVSSVGNLLKPGAGTGTGRFQFRQDAGAIGQEALVWLVVNGYQAFAHEAYVVGDGASHSFTAQIMTNTDTIKLVAFTTMLLEDVGPVNATAPDTWPPNPLPGIWTAPTLTNSWANTGGTQQTARYRKVGDIVYLEGAVQGGAFANAAFTLPTGFRPPLQVQRPAWNASSAAAGLAITSGGAVFIQYGNTASATDIGCSFSTV